jgi:hypothetical protein
MEPQLVFTITEGGPDIDAGVYSVTLTAIEGPKTIVPQTGLNAGKEVRIFDWEFHVDEGEFENTKIEATTSTASGSKSKMFSFVTALCGGKSPALRTIVKAEDLIGRQAIATVSIRPNGWPRIESLGAILPAARPLNLRVPMPEVNAAPTLDDLGDDAPWPV